MAGLHQENPGRVGETLFADIRYPHRESRMCPAAVCAESVRRFCAGSILPDFRHTAAVNCLLQTWIGLIGTPLRLMVNSGTNFQGKQWPIVSNLF